MILYPPQTPILGHIFNFPIRYYGLFMAISFVVGILVAFLIFKNKYDDKQTEIFLDYSPYVILFSIIGARLFYVFGSLDYYLNEPLEIFMINHGGLSIFGAIIFGIITMFACSKLFKFNFLEHCDVVAVSLPICQAIGRFGNYFNQEAFGMPSNGFLKLWVDKQYRPFEFQNIEYFHPAFLYESIIDVLIFIILIYLTLKKQLKKGSIACLYLFLYSFVRFFIEFIRIDSILNFGIFTIAQIISVFIMISSLLLFLKLKNEP